MNKYKVRVDWAGYSRGVATYEVYADSEKDARDSYWDGSLIHRDVVRDDTEDEIIKVEKL